MRKLNLTLDLGGSPEFRIKGLGLLRSQGIAQLAIRCERSTKESFYEDSHFSDGGILSLLKKKNHLQRTLLPFWLKHTESYCENFVCVYVCFLAV